MVDEVEAPKKSSNRLCRANNWSTMLFSMISFTAVYFTTISIFQHIREECATVLHKNKAEIRTEGGATETLVVCLEELWLCVLVVCFSRTFKRIIFFLLCVVLSFAYALCDQFDAMIMPCDTFRKLFAKI